MLVKQSEKLRLDDRPKEYLIGLRAYSSVCGQLKRAISGEVDLDPLYNEDVAELDGSEGRWQWERRREEWIENERKKNEAFLERIERGSKAKMEGEL
jgi:hypothetical protein